MPTRCAVSTCPNYKIPIDPMHRFPADETSSKRKCWEDFAVMASGGSTGINAFSGFGLCCRHFEASDYQEKNTKRLKPDAVPTKVQGFPLCNSEVYELRSKIVKLECKLAQQDVEKKKLQAELEEIQKKLKTEKCAVIQAEEKLDVVLCKFTPGIRKMLLNRQKSTVKYTVEDIVESVKLFNISSKAYTHVRENLLPLPSVSTLQAHLSKMALAPERPIQSVFSLLNKNFVEVNYYSLSTMCVIALDEMSVDSRLVYDANLDQVFGGKKNVTLFCARGIFSKWKQPLLYSFDGKLSHVIDVIKLLYENGVRVIGIVSDMGPKNVKMWRELGIAKVHKGVLNSTSFSHPVCTDDNVYWLTDFPHLLKRLRDHLLDSSITLPGGTVLDRTWITELILKQTNEMRLTFKLGLKNLYLTGQQRQNCSTAYQLFSHTVATAIRVVMKHREGYEEVAAFFDTINDLSDLFNTKISGDNPNKFKTAYGIYFEEQEQLLDKVTNLLMSCKIGKRNSKTYAPFQKGFLILIKSTRELFQELRTKIPGVKYIMLAHLNQDFLENVFSVIRSYGGFSANPNCVQFKYRLRKLVLAWNLSGKNELTVDYDTLVREISSSFVPEAFSDDCSSMSGYSEDIHHDLLYVDPGVDAVSDYNINTMTEEEIITEGGREYIAGYISSKLRTSHPELSAFMMDVNRRNLWIAKLSKGGLIEPSAIWFEYFRKFEDIFRTINPSKSIDMEPGAMKNLQNYLCEKFPEVPTTVVKFYSRTRIYIRIKYINKLQQDERYTREHQRYLALHAESDEEEIERGEEVEEMSSTGKELLDQFLL